MCPVGHNGSYITNIDYAVRGYNLYEHTLTGRLALPYFDISYSRGDMSGDCRHKIPDGIPVLPNEQCTLSLESETITTVEQLDRFVYGSGRVSVGIKILFSAEIQTAYTELKQKIQTNTDIVIFTYALCTTYTSHLDVDHLPMRAPGITTRIQDLLHLYRDYQMEDKYLTELLQDYGTHFPKALSLGSLFMYQFTMSKAFYQEIQSSKLSITSAIRLIYKIRLGTDVDVEINDRKLYQSFKEKVKVTQFSAGAKFPQNSNVAAWAEQTFDNPSPVEFTLAPIEEVLPMINDKIPKTLLEKLKTVRVQLCESQEQHGTVCQ